jgi:hypothetical protein
LCARQGGWGGVGMGLAALCTLFPTAQLLPACVFAIVVAVRHADASRGGAQLDHWMLGELPCVLSRLELML